MSRETQHGQGVPGIFFKYDIEPMALMVEERTMGLIDFLVRLAGIVGGILVCTGYAWRGASDRYIRYVGQGSMLRSDDGILSIPAVGHAAARAAKRQLTGGEGGRGGGGSRGDNQGLMPTSSPQKGLNGGGYRTSYL